MGRLKGTIAYLAGAMGSLPDGGHSWRDTLSEVLWDMGMGVMNPCRKATDAAIEDEDTRQRVIQLKKEHKFEDARKIMQPIVFSDLRQVDHSGVVIGHIDRTIPAPGTCNEISFAIQQHKPTLLVVEQGIDNTPNWWVGLVPEEFLFNDFFEVIGYLQKIDSYQIEPHKRWWFFDYDKVFGLDRVEV